MKMELTVLERILLLKLLPTKGSFSNLKLLRVISEALSFDDEENKKLQFKKEESKVFWNELSPPLIKEIEFGDTVIELIRKQLLEMDKKEELSAELVSLYEKFCQ